MKPGDHADVTRRFSAQDIADFVALSGGPQTDHVPEPLIGALFSYLPGVKLPGPGTNYLKQSLRFTTRARLEPPLTVRVEITRLRDTGLVDLSTTCCLPDGTLLCSGRVLVRDTDA